MRVAAVDALAPFAPEERAQVAAPLLSDKVLAVRIATARALAAVPPASLSPEQRAAFAAAGAEVDRRRKSQRRAARGLAFHRRLRGRARAASRSRGSLSPGAAPRSHIGISNSQSRRLYRATGRDGEAEPLLRQAIAAAPDYAPAEHALGLLLVRQQDMPGALAALQKAVELAPEDARYAYVYAIGLNSVGRSQDALAILKQANARHPADTDILTALATISRDSRVYGRCDRLCRRDRPRRAQQCAGPRAVPVPTRPMSLMTWTKVSPRSNRRRSHRRRGGRTREVHQGEVLFQQHSLRDHFAPRSAIDAVDGSSTGT